jgi:zinc/manganese transport system ATP-binding protein
VTAVAFDQVTLTLGKRDILTGVTLSISEGEFIGVLGPNGSGKTTLMRAILGLLPPSAGSIAVLGERVSRGNPAIGYLPQVRTVAPDLRLTGFSGCCSRRRSSAARACCCSTSRSSVLIPAASTR